MKIDCQNFEKDQVEIKKLLTHIEYNQHIKQHQHK